MSEKKYYSKEIKEYDHERNEIDDCWHNGNRPPIEYYGDRSWIVCIKNPKNKKNYATVGYCFENAHGNLAWDIPNTCENCFDSETIIAWMFLPYPKPLFMKKGS